MLIFSDPFQPSAISIFFANDNQRQMDGPKTTSTSSDSPPPRNLNEQLKSVLFMDDENTLRLVVRLMLERLGYKVTTAEHGQQAIALYASHAASGTPFDVVILDINIENGMDGISTLKRLLQMDPDLKAIGASGSVTPETLNGLLKIGFSSVLAKPFRLEQLKIALEQVLKFEESLI